MTAAAQMAQERDGFADWLFPGAEPGELSAAVATLDIALERLRTVPSARSGAGSRSPRAAS